jgi:Phage tail lysozyme
LTTDSRRNSTTKISLLKDAPAPQGYPDQQSYFEPRGYEERRGYAGPHDYAAPEDYSDWRDYPDEGGYFAPEGQAEFPGRENHPGREGGEPKPDRKAERYTGRHAGTRGGAARTWRPNRVVQVVAASAVVVAGAAAYTLTSGSTPHASELNAAIGASGTLSSTPKPGTASANADAAQVVKIAKAAISSSSARPSAKPKAAKPSASRTPAATSSAAASTPAATPSQTAAAAPAATAQAPSATATASTSQATATTLSCNLSYSLLPENVTAIVSFLLANGYTDNAAAGIAGNIYQESKGNPESVGSGGGGLIGWTPLRAGFVTGNAAADLQTQLSAILTYNEGWSQYVPALNAASSPAAAADIYVTDFERAGIPAASTRESSAAAVAQACGI